MIVGVYTPPAGSGPNVRCAYLTNGAVLSGFTLASGGTPPVLSDQVREASGGGVWCESSNASLVNCILIGNTSGYSGGGVFSGTLTQCVLASNAVVGGRGWGGGAWSSTLRNCVLTGNNGYEGGGAASSRLNNCLLVQNTATYGGGAFSSTLNNCTIVSNSATYNGGGIAGGSADAFATNCIVYYNSAPSSSNWSVGNLAFSCTQPLPGGTGNFTNEPVFTSLAAGDFHPQSNSPCINAGWNPAVSSTTDLDGKPRVVGGTVDIGAYEFQSPSSLLSYAWALQYGLPTDGSADFLDSDGDGMSNWQEWIAGSNPTNATSALIMSSPVTNAVGLQISWQSANGKLYYLQRATNLAASPAFSSIRSNIYGRIGTTIFIDNSATNPGPYFYRVGVQQ
jgi:hypothetical protein